MRIAASPEKGAMPEEEETANVIQKDSEAIRNSNFDIGTALFCAGLAFDSYVEPPANSSRWEKGSKGMNVAFVSQAFTRNLYNGLLEVQVEKIYDLPDDDDTAEGLMTGGGVDASLLVAAIEGQWEQDVRMLERESYHDGVLGLQGAAHVGKSRTAWANANENKSVNTKRKTGVAVPYHIPSTLFGTKGGQAIYTDDEPPFYLYIQDPSKARLVFTVMDDNVVGDGDAVGSAHARLTKYLPRAAQTPQDMVHQWKQEILAQNRDQKVTDLLDGTLDWTKGMDLSESWEGEIKLTSKSRKKDKNSQVAMGAAAGAMMAGPVGAAAGAFLGSMYEGQVRGRIVLKLRYLPLLSLGNNNNNKRKVYRVKGGLEGVDWGEMHNRFLSRIAEPGDDLGVPDLEHCFFINHEETGGCCAVYRSLERKLVVVSFRGTCNAKDLITDASIAQSAWIEGQDDENNNNDNDIAKVHTGFRRSLNSISRRLKELLLATPAPGEDISQYDILVTGHSLGGALSTLFAMDIAEYGIDAGRSLPQEAPSDDWWKAIASQLTGRAAARQTRATPPRPKSVRMYNFGSPRVGNPAFAARFATVVEEGRLQEAYRIVNGDDIVARLPRTINALAFGSVNYDHCGATVLVSQENTNQDDGQQEPILNPRVWIEGESDNERCPVRDGTPLTSPLASGSLLSDIVSATKDTFAKDDDDDDNNDNSKEGGDLFAYAGNLGQLAAKVTGRLQAVTATDLTSIIGIDRQFAEREARIIQSIASGEGLGDHMEDKYYSSMGRATGFVAVVGQQLQEIEEEEKPVS